MIQRNSVTSETMCQGKRDCLKSTLSGKEKSIAFLQSEKEKILSEKKELADSYLDEIVCLKNANKVARDMLQRFNMPTQTILMLSKETLKPIWDSEEVLVHQVVSMKKMSEKPGHVRPANGFYDKLNAMMFVPQKELSQEQAYWLSANEIASQASNSDRPVLSLFRIIKERTTQKPDYVSEWCFDYAKQFVEQQLRFFDELEAEYMNNRVLDNKT
ncbi:hypothetical protein Tco_0358831 [Tanacetum coccineum]